MTNILYLLIKHKGVMAKLRKELDETLGPKFLIPNYDHAKELTYLKACIEEGLRLRPPLSLGLPRKTVAETHFAGHLIKTGVTVSVPTWSLYHDEQPFPNAEAFP
jgi:cytochrome P450